eukprot:gnl/TRDRNA2_/TRDRNA2_201684_c0_seq1.p1 gnl/TRDRNA2_/TRDRNA2_201684_c0~~gnl/TRDRNA2_/TRDRNA2_201684_c0_seq1.p1  ORF type:complete len:373 (+),score=67.80 gnl/TRDRNA2_/TRDRNA2_201684_c0_seq1:70-1188(+)
MTEVHRSKVVSSIEPRPLRRNVTTDFEWEVRSLKEQLSLERNQILSPEFDVHGTEGARMFKFVGFSSYKTTQLTFMRKPPNYILQLGALEYYTLSVTAHLCCGDCEEKSAAVETNGRGTFVGGETKLLSVAFDSALGCAIQERNGFSARVQLTTLSAQGELVVTALHAGQETRPLHSLASSLRSALQSADLADVSLKSEEGATFPAHRQLLGMRSPVFRSMFYGPMMEAQTGTATIKASSAGVQQLLRCIYTDEIDLDAVEPIGFELFELGMQYEIPQLVALVKKQMFWTLSVDNAAERFLLANRHSVEELEKASEAIIKGNLAAVMQTEGWTHIMKDPAVMGRLINGARKCHDNAETSPRKLKRPRSGKQD